MLSFLQCQLIPQVGLLKFFLMYKYLFQFDPVVLCYVILASLFVLKWYPYAGYLLERVVMRFPLLFFLLLNSTLHAFLIVLSVFLTLPPLPKALYLYRNSTR